MQHCSIRTAIIFAFGLFLLAVAGCGGGSSSSKNAVAQVSLTPASLSLESGQVSDPLQVKAVDSTGAAATTTFTFNSSNPSLATISPSGQVCAGVWDSTFVSCNGTTAAGAPLTGSATVTATAQGVTSGPVAVSVHPHVSSIVVDPVSTGTNCFSQKQTHQFVAHACSTAATPFDASGPCSPNAHEISDQIGEFTWSSTSPQVAAVDANGLATASIPGITGVVASVGSASSPATNFKTCMPVSLRLHVPGELTTSATLTLNPATTAQVEADMTDENGTVVNGVPGISLFTNNTAVATVIGPTTTGTVTAVSSGVAGIFAACAPPSCGIGIGQPVYSNIFNITVGGTSPATTVYVASKDLASASTVIPIDTSKTPPAAGTPISLPGHPNSLLFSSDGTKAYIGTDAGLVALGTASNTTTLVGPEATGTVLAVSPDGNHAIVSNAPNETNVLNHRLRFFDATSGTLQTFIIHNAVAAAFTPDGSKAYVGATDGNIYVFSPFATLQKVTPGGSFSNVATLPSGSLAFLSGSAGLSSFNACDNSQGANPATNGATTQLSSILNTDQMVALEATGVDILSSTIGFPAAGFCPPSVSFSNQFVDFSGFGAFTGRQLVVTGNRIVVLPSGQGRIFALVPGSAPAAVSIAGGASDPLSGGLTLDGNTLWVGMGSDHSLHRIDLTTGTDNLQLQPNVNAANSTPDIVAVVPK